MPEPHAPDLVLRLSLPSAREFSSVATEAAVKIVELLGHGAADARAAGARLEALIAEVASEENEGTGDITFEFHHRGAELHIEVRCAGRSSRASHTLPT
jgi:hypothetical protein